MNSNPRTVELYWDVGSTNSYFALKLIEPILERTGAALVLHPFNVGYVFRKNNYVLMDEPPAKISNRKRDLARWAEKYQFPFRFPSQFPIKSSRALRASLAMRKWDLEKPFVDAIMAAYWERDDSRIVDYEGMAPIARDLGVDPEELEALSESREIREQMAASTNRGLERGVFGVPSMFVGDELFWGKDRMDFIEDELLRH